ncbi:S1C family serine protease [Embleya sp. AB8]|uniref:S1C family serine protease n=1 Tax=Embleya sp. AB8 TaxID=3156304 RepID=UPI003C741C98
MSDAYGRGGAEPPRGDDARVHEVEPAAFPRVSTEAGADARPEATTSADPPGEARVGDGGIGGTGGAESAEESATEVRPVLGAEAEGLAGQPAEAGSRGAGAGGPVGESAAEVRAQDGVSGPTEGLGGRDAGDGEPVAFADRPSLVKETPSDPAAEPAAFGAAGPGGRDAVAGVAHGTAELPSADDPAYDPFAPPPQPPPVAPQWPGQPYGAPVGGHPGPYGAPVGGQPGYGPYGPHPSYAPQAAYGPYQAVPYGYPVPGDMTGAGGPTADLGKRYGKRLVGWAAALALVAGLIGGGIGAWVADRHDTKVRLGNPPPTGPARGKDTIAGLAGSTLPGVVYIHAKTGRGEATGTGFVLDTAGDILTNNHVVESAASGGTITVTFNDGQQTTASLVGRDTGYDLAVIRVSGVQGLHPLPLGNSDGVQVGDPVIAIGAPFNLEGTVTSGIISAKDRAVSAGTSGSDVSYISALQTDAPINPGNSGGPLIDAAGSVIGINSAIRSAGGGGQGNPFGGQQEAGSIGLGFAIPINQGRRVAQQLIDTGKASHPVIGVTLDVAYQGDGARIAPQDVKGTPPIRAGGPAEKAGLKPGDVIKAIDGRKVHDANELIVAIRAKAPGTVAKLTIDRDGAERTVEMTLEAG